MADTEGMELELRPRRSPFETGNSKASLATPSCCCCCCCVNAIGAASGIVGADTKARAIEAGRSEDTARWFGVLGFLFIPVLVLVGFIFIPLVPIGDDPVEVLLGLGSLAFLLGHVGIRVLANASSAFSLNGFAASILALLTLLVGSILEAIAAVVTASISVLASFVSAPIAARAGWKFASSMHAKAERADGSSLTEPETLPEVSDEPKPPEPAPENDAGES